MKKIRLRKRRDMNNEEDEERMGIKPLELRVQRRYDGENPDPSKWTPWMKSQVAAHLDSDGCLDITHSSSRGKDYYHVRFSFKGSSKLPIVLAMTYGGTVNPTGGSFVWNIEAQEMLAHVLKAIRPYVLLKAEHIEVALKALKIQKEKKRGWKDKLAMLREKMSQLNDTKVRGELAWEYFKNTDPEREILDE